MRRAAIIVVGGAGARLGGVAKPWLAVGGQPIVEHVIAAARKHADEIILVGTPPAGWQSPTDVRWTCEEPAGSGPAEAVRAGLRLVQADEVLLLAGDAPFVTDTIALLVGAPMSHDGVAASYQAEVQYLLARVNRVALEQAMASSDASMRSAFSRLQIDFVLADVTDADTWEDVARLRASKEVSAMTSNAWLEEAAELLGVDPEIDVDAVLALARDVAHGLERKYAPLTSYLLGYAAAQRNLTPAQVAELAALLGKRAQEGAADA